MQSKNVQKKPPAPTASAIGPCPTIIQLQDAPVLEVYPGPSHHPTTPSVMENRGRHNADTSYVYMITFYLCVYMRLYASVVLFLIFSPILLSMNCHSDYNTIDGRIAGNRRPYSDIFQSSIKSPREHEFCQTHFVVEA